MSAHEFKSLKLVEISTTTDQEEEFSIPLDISDIINICREYNSLGWQIQKQVETILEVGVDEAISSGKVNKDYLPHIKGFLKAVYSNPYFGDAASQAYDCIKIIQEYENKSQNSNFN